MSIYTLLPDAQQQAVSYAQTETFTYGISRVASNKETTELISPVPKGNVYSNKLGYKHFELTNHLGNILTTISDIKEQQDYNSNNEVDCYTAQIISNTDYYPFGVNMTERSYNNTSRRYGFNGKENDEETETMDFGARLLDGDLGVWLACDPLAIKYPYVSPYNYVENNPIIYVDPNGKGPIIVIDKANKKITFIITAVLYANENVDVDITKFENESYNFNVAPGVNFKYKNFTFTNVEVKINIIVVKPTVETNTDNNGNQTVITTKTSKQNAQEMFNSDELGKYFYFEVINENQDGVYESTTAGVDGKGLIDNTGYMTKNCLESPSILKNLLFDEAWHSLAGENHNMSTDPETGERNGASRGIVSAGDNTLQQSDLDRIKHEILGNGRGIDDNKTMENGRTVVGERGKSLY
jgi:RHS repeat-associated protein